MKKKLKLMMSMLLSAIIIACNSDVNESGTAGNHPMEPRVTTELCGTSWKLYGFGKDDYNIQKAEPSDCSSCYVVKFEPDGSFSGKTTSNDFFGIYSTENKSFKIEEYGTTEVGEMGDGYRFFDAFLSSVQYEIANGKLKLYSNSNDFLIFNPQ